MNNFYSAEKTSVVLLAAGHGKRMLPLTEQTPKPLLKVGKHALIEHHLYRLKAQGFKHVVINISYLAEQFPTQLGTGERYGLTIEYSDESASGALETAGGVRNALSLINSDPFITINADIWTDFNFNQLLSKLDCLGRLVMVANPEHNKDGDFVIDHSGLSTSDSGLSIKNGSGLSVKNGSGLSVKNGSGLLKKRAESGGQSKTFSGIALYKKELFVNLGAGKRALSPVFNQLIEERQLEGIKFDGSWNDIGTPERLESLNQRYKMS